MSKGRARKLEPNLGDVPTEIVRSPQSGVKRPGKAFSAMRGPSRAWLCRFWPAGPEHVLNISGAHVENRCRSSSVMPGDSVWLCSTHPKPSRHVPGLAGTRRGALRNRGFTCAWSTRKTGGTGGPSGILKEKEKAQVHARAHLAKCQASCR